MHEVEYDAGRNERLLYERGLTRRDLVKLGAASGRARHRRVRHADSGRPSRHAENGSPIAKSPARVVRQLRDQCRDAVGRGRGLGYTTPNERFFVRDHTGTPIIDPSTWSFRVFGTGLKGPIPASFTYAQLQGLPRRRPSRHRVRRQRPLVLRSQQGTPAPGHSGPRRDRGGTLARRSLAEVLDRAGITADAVDVMPYGLDATSSRPASTTATSADRSPSRSARNALVALEMNGSRSPPITASPPA